MSPNLAWSLEPGSLIGVALVGGVYVRRWRQVRASSTRPWAEAPVWRLVCFLGSLLAALAALVSPLDTLSDQLFFAHMIQHILLLDLVPILAILGLDQGDPAPRDPAVRDLERRAGPLAHPAFAVVLYVGVIWIWHVPAAYDLALRHPAVHVLEHTTFLLAGSLYWWHLLSPSARACASAGWARSRTWPPPSCSSARSAWDSPSRRPRCTPTTCTTPACGASRRSMTSRSPASSWPSSSRS